ncbi:unnamed protein product, partial [Closterium sp. NIES-54]
TASTAAATAASAAPADFTAMASLRVLAFNHEGRPVQFDTWLDNLSDIKDGVSLFDHVSGAATTPPTTADVATRSQWLSRDAAARLVIHNHLPLVECAHFGQHRTAQALYDAVVARYSSPATVALGCLFPDLSSFTTVEDLVSHLRASDARYRAAVPAEFLDKNQPPMFITLYFIVTRLLDSLRSVRDHFLSLDPTSLTVDLLEQHLSAAETSAVAMSLLLKMSWPLLLLRSAAAARARVARVVEVAAVVVEVEAGVVAGAAVEVVAAVGLVEGVGALVAAVEAAVGVAVVAAIRLVELGLALGMVVLEVASVSSSSVGARPRRPSSFVSGFCVGRLGVVARIASGPVSPVCIARRVPRLRPPPVPGTHAMTLRPSSVPLRVPLPAPPESCLPEVPDPGSGRARAASPTVSRLLATAVIDPSFESAAVSALVAELLDFAAAHRLDYTTALVAESTSAGPPFVGDSDAPDIPTPRSYAEAITGPYSSQWQAAMDAEMASWKSTGTYVDEVPPRGANIVDGMWIFRVKRPPGSPPAFKARYIARGFNLQQGVDFFQTFSPTPKMTTLRVLLHVAAQRDYELHSLDFSTAFLQGSLHEEIWLRRPPGFTESLAAGTLTTLAALGFAPATADPSLFLHTDTSLPPFYVLVYVDVFVFGTADTEALTLVKLQL